MDMLYVLSFAVLLAWEYNVAESRQDTCPESCFCNTESKIVHCSRRGVKKIPSDIPPDSLQFYLNGNIFESSILKRANFSGVRQLESIYMSECGIEKIEVDTFSDLRALQWLDLSNNRIKMIEDHTFRGLKLQHLFLNGNRNIHLGRGSFAGLETTGLYLGECSLSKLSLDIFVHLNNTLKNLWLYGNEITRIEKKFHSVFNALNHIRLGSNPLHCNCEMRWLKEFYDENIGKFEGAVAPSCLTPQKMKGKFFNEITLFDFQCRAPYFTNIDAVFRGGTGMLRCSANGDPSPRLYWVQPSGESSVYKPSINESVHRNEAVLNISEETSRQGNLSGSYFCIAVNADGNMTFTFNLTWPSPRVIQEVSYKTLPTENNSERVISRSSTSTPIPRINEKELQDILNSLLSTKKPKKVIIDEVTTKTAIKLLNETAETVEGNNETKTEKMFSLAELIGAIVGTHLCTLLLCLIIIPIYFRRRWNNNSSPRHGVAKPSQQEVRYLNGMGSHYTQTYYRDYFDTPTSSIKR